MLRHSQTETCVSQNLSHHQKRGQVVSNAPYQRGPQSSRKRTKALRFPHGPYAVQRRSVLLPIEWGKPVRLHSRLNHIYGVYHSPELFGRHGDQMRALHLRQEGSLTA
jgi:hypothetical protein